MEDVFVEVTTAQSAKRPAGPCGDVVRVDRTAAATTVLLADGIGAGIRAHVAATLAVERLSTLLASGFSLRDAFERVVRTLEAWRSPESPYAVLTAARILPGGEATVLGYEMPPAVRVAADHAAPLPRRPLHPTERSVQESTCVLSAGEGLLLTSDGITEAGMGLGLREGWTAEGVAQFLTERLQDGAGLEALPGDVHARARGLWGRAAGDDCTAVLAACRPGRSVTLLTGPPASREDDEAVVERFLSGRGRKIVCGASTALMVARRLGRALEVVQDEPSLVAPPRYRLQGVDLVTEGTVTLNQVCNVIDEDPANHTERSAVSDLCTHLHLADRVHLLHGGASNPANDDILFRQQGLMPRGRVVPLLAERLRAAGKLVVVERV